MIDIEQLEQCLRQVHDRQRPLAADWLCRFREQSAKMEVLDGQALPIGLVFGLIRK
jgi:hypothetical protein